MSSCVSQRCVNAAVGGGAHCLLYFTSCTLALHNSLTVAFFDRRPDGSVWLASDVVRESVAGTAMSVIGALCHIKADWAEIITTFGYPSWSSIFNLCFCCEAEKDDMMAIGPDENAGVDSLPWRLKTHDSYTAACNRCEFGVAIPTRDAHRIVLCL